MTQRLALTECIRPCTRSQYLKFHTLSSNRRQPLCTLSAPSIASKNPESRVPTCPCESQQVMEDMAAQLLCLMRRVQSLELQLGRADASSSRDCTVGSLRLSASGAAQPPPPPVPNITTLLEDMVALKERLAKLEACSQEWDSSDSKTAGGKEEAPSVVEPRTLQQRVAAVDASDEVAREQLPRLAGENARSPG
jgi:hypothetical protein